MIRGNYSLAQEVRKNESKQRQKIQERQKHQHKLEKLTSCDPVKLYFHIQRLESLEGRKELDASQLKKLQSLRQDWSFIIKNKLFEDKVNKFLKSREEAEKARLRAERKLWGRDSVFFNAELNPLGKVPNAANVTIESCHSYPNLKKTSESKLISAPDPLIQELGIRPPSGDPPRFYKTVQNKTVPSTSSKAESISVIPQKRKGSLDYHDSVLDTDSEHEVVSDD